MIRGKSGWGWCRQSVRIAVAKTIIGHRLMELFDDVVTVANSTLWMLNTDACTSLEVWALPASYSSDAVADCAQYLVIQTELRKHRLQL